MTEEVSKELVWPEKLTLRDTQVFADEGQRIFTTATGYGYEKQEYVRADIASRSPTEARGEPVAWLNEAGFARLKKELLATVSASKELPDDAPLYSHPPVREAVDLSKPPFDDLLSHAAAWRNGLVEAKHNASPAREDMDDGAYWQHEIEVFDRVFGALAALQVKPAIRSLKQP